MKDFLSTALVVLTKDPHSCVPLFSMSESKCVYTLGRLLTTDWLSVHDFLSIRFDSSVSLVSPTPVANNNTFIPCSQCLLADGGPERLEEDLSRSSLSVLCWHLLCFPFALDLTPHAMSRILLLYDTCGIVEGLLQVRPFACSRHRPVWMLSQTFSDATQDNACSGVTSDTHYVLFVSLLSGGHCIVSRLFFDLWWPV